MDLRKRAERLFERLEPAGGEDVRLVMDAARALDVKEFDFFRLAWRHYHGAEPELPILERTFAQYMLHQRVPYWLRRVSRDILRLKGNGTLNPSKFGVSLVRPPPAPPPPHARLTVAGVVAVICLFVVLLIAAPQDPAGAASPLCAGGPGMGYTETVARMFTGKSDPYACAEARHARTLSGRDS